eukprot:1064752-Amphidinium_carterae.1
MIGFQLEASKFYSSCICNTTLGKDRLCGLQSLARLDSNRLSYLWLKSPTIVVSALEAQTCTSRTKHLELLHTAMQAVAIECILRPPPSSKIDFKNAYQTLGQGAWRRNISYHDEEIKLTVQLRQKVLCNNFCADCTVGRACFILYYRTLGSTRVLDAVYTDMHCST